ncbi:MAG: putative hydrolase [Rhodospirillales bacterium]|nr:putative hydrolase [Rhodospirillales bacterium]
MTADAPGRRIAAAVLLCGGRYLLQLRDAKPTILLPDHWACFGGGIEEGENPEAALRRELVEELEFRPRRMELLTEMRLLMPLRPPRHDTLSFFLVPVDAAEIAAMVQHEGAGKRLFTADQLAAERRVSPWDLAVILMHARDAALFRGGEAP